MGSGAKDLRVVTSPMSLAPLAPYFICRIGTCATRQGLEKPASETTPIQV